jgi:CheY-like chemotaxis protein
MTHVFVVDDAADIRLLLRAVLARAGFFVTEAASGTEALAVLMDAQPDVVLLDVQMPEADGWAVLASLREQPVTASLPVVLCSVKAHPNDRARAWHLGCDGYLTKPFEIRDVVDTVRAVVGRSVEERAAVRRQELAAITYEGASS